MQFVKNYMMVKNNKDSANIHEELHGTFFSSPLFSH